MNIFESVIFWGSVASAVTAIVVLLGRIFTRLKKISDTFTDIQDHTEENYKNNLRLVIMSPYMPLSERLRAGQKYVDAGGNGAVKAYYHKLQEDYENQINNE